MYRWLIPLVFIVGCDDHIFSGGAGHSVELTGGGSIEDVQAIIDAQCLACHGGSGGLSLEGDLCDAGLSRPMAMLNNCPGRSSGISPQGQVGQYW